jgi:glycosyltransferase involved in cell wall biosynthesis
MPISEQHASTKLVDAPALADADDDLQVSVVIPCLNEAESIEIVVRKSLETFEREGIKGEVVVADNGSTDGSQELAANAGARVINETRKGYGSAYLAGFAAARGKYIVMGDADDTYDFTELDRFIGPLDDGADLVIGNRLKNIHPGAMPWLHRYIGNPVLTGILNLFFHTGVADAHCGMRAFRRDTLPALALRTTGMEFASEHVIRSSKLGLDIRQVDIDYYPRKGESKLSSFSDGWRHLRFLLVHSPTWLFVIPGLLLVVLGLFAGITEITGLSVLGRTWDIHTLIGGALLVIGGAQIVQFGLFARTYAAYYLDEHDELFDRWRDRLTLEHGLIAGGALLLIGFVACLVIVIRWIDHGFGALREEQLAIAGMVLVVLGMQVVFGSFFLSVLGLHRRPRASDELVDA